MKKIIKYISIIFILILLTGCSGNYNVIINSDLSVNEELELTIDNEYGQYQKTLSIFEKNNIDKDNYDVNVEDDEIKIKYNEKFDSIEQYISNSKVYKQLINNIQLNRNNDYIDIYVDENLKIKNKYTNINGTNLVDLDVIQVNITNPFKVVLTNADMINDNVYTWSITKDDISKKIQMQFKPKLDVFPIKPVVVGIVILISSTILIYNLLKRYKGRQRI